MQKNLPSQTPNTHPEVPVHSALEPHLHVPNSQESDFELRHIGFPPHIHSPEEQVSDNSVQCSFAAHSEISSMSRM